MERRVAPPGDPDLVEVVEKLVTPAQGRAEALFRSKQKALMFAAALGWDRKMRTPVQRRGEPIRYTVFQGALDDGFVNALAVAETGDLQVLSADQEEERIRIFEEYAHAGLVELRGLLSAPGDMLEVALQLLAEARNDEPAAEGVRPDLAKLFGR